MQSILDHIQRRSAHNLPRKKRKATNIICYIICFLVLWELLKFFKFTITPQAFNTYFKIHNGHIEMD